MIRLLLLCALLAGTARAQVPDVRIARQLSMGCLQLNVPDHERLLQKHAVWTMAPRGTEAVAAFMNEIGSIKAKAASWKE